MPTREDPQDWTRRHFLAAGSAVVGAATLGGAARAAGQGSQDKNGSYGPFKMGLQSYSLRGLGQQGRPDVQRALEATRDLGVHYWEAFPAHVPMTAHPQQIAERKRQFESCGVTLMGYGVVH